MRQSLTEFGQVLLIWSWIPALILTALLVLSVLAMSWATPAP